MKKWILLLCIAANSTVEAQKLNHCGFKIPPRRLATNFQSVYEARDILNAMLDSIRWKQNFSIREQNGINNAYATVIGNKRWIIYDNDFLENLDYHASTKWASISVLAHEMGHHYKNHVLDNRGSTPPKEIEADFFSGYVMQRLGATLQQATAAMDKIAPERGGSTHPGKADRIAAITKGWNAAFAEQGKNPTAGGGQNSGGQNSGGQTGGGQSGQAGGGQTGGGQTGGGQTGGGQTGGNGGPANVADSAWMHLTAYSNENIQVQLSDDGRKYTPVDLEPGKPFVFVFEIYNYGFIRLRYNNGFRVYKMLHGRDYAILFNRRTGNWTLVEIPR